MTDLTERILGAPRRAHLAAIAALSLLLYAGTLRGTFDFDTPELLLYNQAVHGLTVANLVAVTTSMPNTVEYLPVRDVTWMIDWELFGMSAWGYHLSNALYYALCCVLCYLFVEAAARRFTPASRGVALLATLLFVAHPVHVESVAGVAQRKDIVSGLFLFLCLWAFLQWRESRRAGWYAAALIALPLALLSKATAVVAPALLFLLVLPELRRDRRVLLELAPFAGITGAIAFVTMRLAAGSGILYTAERPVLPVALTFAKVAFHYLRMLLLGGPLTIVHDLEPVQSAADPVGLAALAGLLALAGALAAAARRWPLIALGGAFFLVAIVPVAGLLPAPNLAADRYLFIPALGVTLAAASALVELAGGRTVARAEDWRTNERLLVADLRANPSSLRLTTSLARYYYVNGRVDLAFEYFERARVLQPSNPEPDLFVALRLLQLGDRRGALAALDRIPDGGSIVDVQCLYGMVHEAEGRPGEAAAAYRRALAAERIMGVLFKRNAQEGLARVARGSGAGR